MLESLVLDRRLRLALDELNFSKASAVQQQVIPIALSGTDAIFSAETGSGKTLAYLIPLVQRLLSEVHSSRDGPNALILAPTRELARQIYKECTALLAKTPLRAYAITGGEAFKYQQSLFRRAPEVIVGTPGRLLEHCERASTSLNDTKILVLDEADRMLDSGFRDDVLALHARCESLSQVLMTSATMQHKGVLEVSKLLLRSPQRIEVETGLQAHSQIEHQCMLADSQAHKDKLLVALLTSQDYSRVLIFANKRSVVMRLYKLLQSSHLRCACLHGDMTTEERRAVLASFKGGKVPILCASDLAARGLDVKQLDLVINYDMPTSPGSYIHRTGRTGRAGTSGVAISMVTAGDWNLLSSIEEELKIKLVRRYLTGLKPRFDGQRKQKSTDKSAARSKVGRLDTDSSGENAEKGVSNRKKQARRKGVTIDGHAPLTKNIRPKPR
ncbi:MAG: DEAD/DEAH box helicase [Pseudomonadota bacterium]